MSKRLGTMWGTYGKGGIEHCGGTCPEHRLRWKLLTDCDTEHLQMILKNQRHIYDYPRYVKAIQHILISRGEKPATFDRYAEYALNEAYSQARKYA